MTKEELVRAEDMGNYFRVTPDNRDLNYEIIFKVAILRKYKWTMIIIAIILLFWMWRER